MKSDLQALGLFRSLGLFSFVLHFVVHVVQGQSNCQNAEALASTTRQQFSTCSIDLSACSTGSVCADCVDSGDLAGTTCVDGCSYSNGGYTVERSFSSAYGIGYLLDVAVPIISLGFSHYFAAGAEGNFIYSYSGTILDDLTTAPALGGTCTFQFNGVACTCAQFYCGTTQETFGNKIDCSAVEGGAIIDTCVGVPLDPAPTTLLEILYAVPFVVCSGTNLDGSPVTSTDPAPSPADTDATATDSPVTNEQPDSSSVEVSTSTSTPDTPAPAPGDDTESLPPDSPDQTETATDGETPNTESDETPTTDEAVGTNDNDTNDSPPKATFPGGSSTTAPAATRASGAVSTTATVGLWLIVSVVALIQSL